MKPEILQSVTPLFLSFIGGAIPAARLSPIALSVVFSNLSEAKTAAGLGIAGTCIAGASGLAQSKSAEEGRGQEVKISLPVAKKELKKERKLNNFFPSASCLLPPAFIIN